jgi:hypothetical protein
LGEKNPIVNIPVEALYKAVSTYAMKHGIAWLDMDGEHHFGAGEERNDVRPRTMRTRFEYASQGIRANGKLAPICVRFIDTGVVVTYSPDVLAALMAYRQETKEQIIVPVVLEGGEAKPFLAWVKQEFPEEMA